FNFALVKNKNTQNYIYSINYHLQQKASLFASK
ncbi:hypothetical protein EC902281_2109, partial [Escherichia coli 90.2281]